MTNETTTTRTDTDPRPLFFTAYATAGKVIAGIGADQLTLPTPCEDFDVDGLVGHLRMVAERVAVVGRGEDAFGNYDPPPAPADGDLARWWDEAGDAITRAWPDHRLTETIELPWASIPGWAALAGYINELTVHTWDLAVATGQTVAWDPDTVRAGWDALRAVLSGPGRTAEFDAARDQLPEHYRSARHPFAEPVAVADDAPLMEQVVAWNGRNPEAWRPTTR